MKKTYLTLLLLHVSLFASFSGIIIDKETSKPLSNVTINDSKHGVKSDAHGKFTIESSELTYFVKAYGYKPLNFDSNLTDPIIEVEPRSFEG